MSGVFLEGPWGSDKEKFRGKRGPRRGASLNAALCTRIVVVPRPPSDDFPWWRS